MNDRVGLGWRGELAAGIFANLHRIDVLEVIAEDWSGQSRREQQALAALAAERPVVLHGVSLGLASAFAVDTKRLDRMARLVERIRPEAWSEHLAFVRAGAVEIGHLAAPPRTAATIDGAIANIQLACRIVGVRPAMENIATLIEPPGSAMGEAAWVRAIVADTGCDLLLDLHNLYANALNFGEDPLALLQAMPLDRVSSVHLSGGRWINSSEGRARLLDDHLHDVPAEVFAMLEVLAALSVRPLTVLIERDGNYPEFSVLLDQMDRARAALERGRALAAGRQVA